MMLKKCDDLTFILIMIIVRDKILIEDENYSHFNFNRKVLLHMVAIFIAGTVTAYAIVMKHVLNNVVKPHTR